MKTLNTLLSRNYRPQPNLPCCDSCVHRRSSGGETRCELDDRPEVAVGGAYICDAYEHRRLVELAERAKVAESRLEALRTSRLAMTDGNELYWLDGEPGTPSGMTYATAEIESLADAIIAQEGGADSE